MACVICGSGKGRLVPVKQGSKVARAHVLCVKRASGQLRRPKRKGNPCPNPERPALAIGEAERRRLMYGGRRTDLLKEKKHFDAGRLEKTPLFEAHGRQLSMFEPAKKNPPPHGVRIYKPTRGVTIEGMQKPPGHPCDAACQRANHKYKHRFKESIEIFGLPNGDILLKGKKMKTRKCLKCGAVLPMGVTNHEDNCKGRRKTKR